MRMGPNLFNKALFLVLVPMCFEVIFIITLAGLLQESEKQTFKENHSKIVIASLQHVTHQFYYTGLYLQMWRVGDSSWAEQKYEESSKSIEHDLADLERLIKQYPLERKQFRPASKAIRRAVAALRLGKEMISVGAGSGTYSLEMQMSLRDLIKETEKFVAQQERVTAQAITDRANARRNVVSFLYAWFIASVLIAVGVLLWFTKTTVSRLVTLMENSRRLARNEGLLEPVKGSDEIAHLDKVFHEMADSLTEAARYKQELMQMVSHDLKTPLNSVQISLTSLSEGVYGDLPDEALRQVRISEYNTTRLIHLIRDLLDIEKLEAGRLDMELAESDWFDIADDSINAVEAFAEIREIKLERSGEPTTIYCDSERLVQVLVNLLSNAIKFSPRKSTISLNVEKDKNWTVISVVDQGRGIPQDKIDIVFNRFQQVRKEDASEQAGAGTGLGLAICKSIIEAHKGQIWVTSKEGEGSTFWIRIPAAA